MCKYFYRILTKVLSQPRRTLRRQLINSLSRQILLRSLLYQKYREIFRPYISQSINILTRFTFLYIFTKRPQSRGFDDDLTPRVATTTNRPYHTTPRWSLTTPLADYNEANYEDEDDDDLITTSTVRARQTVPTTTEKQTQPPTTTVASTLPTTTQTTTTEFVEPANHAPTIKTRLPKQPLTAGKPFTLKIPLNIFYDVEDGTNLKLELVDNKEQPLNSNSWIQFDADKREIYGLPLEDSVSKWIFYLRATDSGGKYVIETVDLTVQQHKTHRSDNHEISIAVRLTKKVKSNVDWQIRLIRGKSYNFYLNLKVETFHIVTHQFSEISP